jgi:Na+:H+ antiporter, NhaA family
MGVKRDRPVEKVVRPFQAFADKASSGGILLIAATAVALVWANSPWGDTYSDLWQMKLTIGLDGFSLTKDLTHWINDGLMAVFFFLVGLEIKREILVGELASLRRASLPIAAAIGGMVVPALFYAAVNVGGAGARGWGIPMATDIAFALGVLALAGPRLPAALKSFLLALAIVDDIGAILVIALFYSQGIAVSGLLVATALVALIVALQRLDVRSGVVYVVLGIAVWLAFYQSGVHPTVAGVMHGNGRWDAGRGYYTFRVRQSERRCGRWRKD